jgi:thymidine phosphorylase
MQVLQNHPAAPADLRQKSLRLAGRMLEFDPDVRGGDGFAIARDILDSGRALRKMQDIIQAQGSKPYDVNNPPLAPLTYTVRAATAGTVVNIDNLQLARIARQAGAPRAQGAGVDLHAKLGEQVQAGDLLYTVYAAYPTELGFARKLCERGSGFTLGAAADITPAFMEF